MSDTLESRKISDLKVPELRSELEKRDLDKTGVKAVLLERLQKASIETNCFCSKQFNIVLFYRLKKKSHWFFSIVCYLLLFI